MANKKLLQKDEFLLREGEHSDNMYWLQTGQLVVLKRKGLEEIQLGHIFGGELVGEMSFLDGEPRSATVKAITDCELIEIPRDVFEKVFIGQPTWFQGLVKTLTERLRKTNAKVKI
jgi:CRP-like cAMP-binding protein